MKNTIQSKYEGADQICDMLDGSGTVSYSEKAGFFIEFIIFQKKIGRTWETISEDDFDDEANAIYQRIGSSRKAALDSGRYRILETFRPICRDQAIRIFLNGYSDNGGMMTVIAESLDKAGIEPLKETI